MNKQEKEFDLDKEIKTFLSNADSYVYEDQIEILKNLVKKFVYLDTVKIKLGKHDLNNIISTAKGAMANDTMPIKMGGRNNLPLTLEESRMLKIVESTIGYLTGKDCFKRQPVMDYNLEEPTEGEG